MLTELGFGLDLSACAATGSKDQLIYVSPKSGQAVSRSAGKPHQQKMLPLPAFLTSNAEASGTPGLTELISGLELTGYFLKRHIFAYRKNGEPAARTRLIDRLKHLATISCS